MKPEIQRGLKRLASYLSSFSSNLAVAGIAVALFKEDN